MLSGWTILNVKRRVDRRLIAVMQAHMMSIPMENIHIWEAKDAVALNIKELPTLLDTIADDGFPQIRDIDRFKPDVALGRVCQLWNICRFLRHLIETNQTQMFIHDGVVLKRNNCFIPTYRWWGQIVTQLNIHSKAKGHEFLFLLNGHKRPHFQQNITPIAPDSEILHGISAFDNFARVYSPAGAKFVLERILTRPIKDANRILYPKSDEKDFLSTPGTYSMRNTMFTDLPNEWLGSNRVDHLVSYRDRYARLFPPDIIPTEWKTG